MIDVMGNDSISARLAAVAGVLFCLGVALAPAAPAQNPLAAPSASEDALAIGGGHHEFHFTRAVYSGLPPRFSSWSIDFPKADRQFLIGLDKLTRIDASGAEHPVRLDDPELRKFPILYAVEVGYMALAEEERRGLRDYLLAGGFLIADDFWGSWEWANFEAEIRAVLPEYQIAEVPLDHPVLHVFYSIDEILQVPNVHQGRAGGPTWESDGYTPAFRGIFDDNGRLMVAIIWNCDLGDAWEWAEDPFYPLQFSNFAYQMGVNLIVYGMSY